MPSRSSEAVVAEPAPARVQAEPPDDGDDRDLAAEHLLLFLPGGPAIVELRITIDGHPFREPREELVGEMLAAADRNHDGRPTWGEVFADPKRLFGQPVLELPEMSNRKEFIKHHDSNRNGLVDRDEARRFVRLAKRAESAFRVQNAVERDLSDARQSLLFRLLDVDGNELLDADELAAVEERLLVRDLNDDQIVAWSELDDSLAGDEQALERRKAPRVGQPVAVALGARLDQNVLRQALETHGASPAPAGQTVMVPDAVLSASFTTADGSRPHLALAEATAESPALSDRRSEPQTTVAWQTSGCRVRFLLDNRLPSAERRSMPDEKPAKPQPRPAPHLSGITAVVRDDHDVLFSLLDARPDGRLTTRELRVGSSALARLDANDDRVLTLDEIPASIVVVLGRGAPVDEKLLAQPIPAGGPDDLPRWFRSLDTNGDGEVSREEFPAGEEKFAALDLNGDGFLSDDEALQEK